MQYLRKVVYCRCILQVPDYENENRLAKSCRRSDALHTKKHETTHMRFERFEEQSSSADMSVMIMIFFQADL